jgi:hypothetical protein
MPTLRDRATRPRMNLPERVVITILIVAVAATLCLLDGRRLSWLSDPSWWRWGWSDPIRFAMFRDDRSARKPVIVMFYALLLALVWLI